MSISTKRGDDGLTDLLFGERVTKNHPVPVACGDVDELNAALGMARAWTTEKAVDEALDAVQRQLIALMGELATPPEELERYREAGFAVVGAADVERLTNAVGALETELGSSFNDWAIPGASTTPCGAAFDFARTVCRRAERSVVPLHPLNGHIVPFLNRLSDWLWLMARRESRQASRGA